MALPALLATLLPLFFAIAQGRPSQLEESVDALSLDSPSGSLPSSSLLSGLSSASLSALLLGSGGASSNGLLQLRRLLALRAAISSGYVRPALYPALALDVDGDGLADQLLLHKSSPLLGEEAIAALLAHANSGQYVLSPKLVGPPVKVYQHQRTLHLPTTESHYVQRSIGPAVESNVVQGLPLQQQHLESNRVYDYGLHSSLYRRKREVEAEAQVGAEAEASGAAVEVEAGNVDAAAVAEGQPQ